VFNAGGHTASRRAGCPSPASGPVSELAKRGLRAVARFWRAEISRSGVAARPAINSRQPARSTAGPSDVRANGLYRHGFLLAPALGQSDWWADLILGRPNTGRYSMGGGGGGGGKLQLNGAPIDSDATTLAALLFEAKDFGGKGRPRRERSFVPPRLRATHPLNFRRQHRSARPMREVEMRSSTAETLPQWS